MLKRYETFQRAVFDGAQEAQRLDEAAARAEIVREHRATCAVCLGGGDCCGPFGDWQDLY